ncbi:MAG TPA: BamA/TamA family outer membrane protein [Thermoanaerobaculia bacterium]|nr:BamA/TamA family outer membrane protein [Thermoanaerobaculia bacterium]
MHPKSTLRRPARRSAPGRPSPPFARRASLRRSAGLLAAAAVALAAAPAAQAQYFGRNKVLWEEMEFQVLRTEHFDVYYYPAEHPAIEELGRMSERWYERLAAAFDHRLTERKPIIFYADQPDFRQTTVTLGQIGEGTGGFTEPLRNRVAMPLTGVMAETDHVLGHELVHVFQFDIVAALATTRRTNVALGQVPLWMIEGLAEYFSVGREDPHTALWMRDSVLHDDLPTLSEMNRGGRFNPYQYGQAFWAYVGGRWGDQTASLLFGNALVLGPERAIEETLGLPAEQLFADWHAALRDTYQPVIAARQRPEEVSELVLSSERTGGDLNVAPAISPDGRRVAFLSTRDLFSVDLFLADAETGEVLRRLVRSSANPHFDSIRFLDSAGAWSPDGERFAFVVFEEGDHAIAVVDVESRNVVERYRPDVGAIANPAYSPDGRTLAFSGSRHGITDLYLLDLGSGDVRQLTDDLYAQLQPQFSPDGRRIAFVTDQGPGTDLGELSFHPLRLALYDLGSGDVEIVTPFPGAKHIDPAWSPDGSELYFISDVEGVSDLFALSLGDRGVRRLTRLATGVSGITDVSPSMSVARRTGRLLYSVRDDGEYEVYGLDPRAVAAETAAAGEPPAESAAGILPPVSGTPAEPTETTVARYLDRPEAGLPSPAVDFPREGYDPDFGLTYVGPPTLGIGASEFGYGVGGTVSAYWSDILNRHLIGATLQGGAGSDDFGSSFGAQVAYLNQTDRFVWGGEASHIPVISARTSVSREPVQVGDEIVVADVVRQLREEILVDELYAIGQYPLSTTRRFETRAGATLLSFDTEIEEVIVVGNQVLDSRTTELGSLPDLELYSGSLAYVGDSSFFGFSAPVRGERFRFEVEAFGGDLDYQTGLADYRRYFFNRPWTFAVRGLHFGRYGTDAENDLLGPIYLGRETLVRGYALGDFDATECTAPPGSNACPEFDRLTGSRVAVVNLEFRVPLFGVEEYGLFELPFLPTDLVLFADAGTAWTEDESPDVRFDRETTDRVPVFSAGVAARIVLGGYLPLELYYAKPFQRPDTDWQFGFVIAPGW